MNAPFLRPHGCPIGIDPATWRKAVAERIEAHLAELQALIDALDRSDTDSDLEPSLAAAECQPGRRWLNEDGDQSQWTQSSSDDRESGDVSDEGEPDVDDEDDGTREPSLGAPDQADHGSQELWAAGARGDHERELDPDREPDVDDEPSLGWSIPGGASLTNPPHGWSYPRLGGIAGDYED